MIINEHKRVTTELQHLQAHIKTLPPGHFLCSRNGSRYKWYHSDGTIFCPISKKLNTWMHDPYDQHTGYPEQLSIQTCSGKLVRSKSEALIDMILSSHKIPFRYKSALSLGPNTLYPDFTIRHPQNDQTFYWEHFGLMDDPCYSNNAFAKLQLYASYGIIPSINLITTYETKEHPLSPSAITKIAEEYFL